MYKIEEKINKFMEVFTVNRVQAKPIAIEDAMSRTNQRFWRVKLDTGDTLYTYQRSTIGNLVAPDVPGQPTTLLPNVAGQVCVFDLEQKGKYYHIVASGLGGQPAAVAPSALAPAPIAPAPVVPAPVAQVAPVTFPPAATPAFDAAEQTMADIATPQATLTPGFTQAPPVTATPPTFSGGDGKNAGVCMSYAKDLAVAGVITVDQIVNYAETMFNWVQAHK